MENLNEVVSKNLVKFRNLAGYTQSEIAEKISYSNKSISKWERGEGLPDLNVLVKLSEIYNVKLDDFLSQNQDIKNKIVKKKDTRGHFLVFMLSLAIVWLVAVVLFSIVYLFPSSPEKLWLIFLYAIPVFGIVMSILAKKWKLIYLEGIATSIICWGFIVSFYFTFDVNRIWVLYIVGALIQLVVFFCYGLLVRKNKKLKKQQ